MTQRYLPYVSCSPHQLTLCQSYLERLVEKLDLCGPLELVPAVGGDDELDPVAVLQREVADLVFFAEWNFDFGPKKSPKKKLSK